MSHLQISRKVYKLPNQHALSENEKQKFQQIIYDETLK